MKKYLAVFFVCLFLLELPLWAGLGSDKAMYVGGTVSGLKEKTEGKVSSTDEKVFSFQHKSGTVTIPYERITSLEYGQKAGRRVGLSIAVSPLFLLSKKRRHFLTIGYLDENQKQQAAVFELGKSIIQPTITSLESRTGKKVDYEDEESRKSGAGK
jgi:hypothetical protein